MKYIAIGIAALGAAMWAYMNWDAWWFRSIQPGPGTMTIYWHDLSVGDPNAPRCPERPPMNIDGPRFSLSEVTLGKPGAPLTNGMQEHLRARGTSGLEGEKMTEFNCLYSFRNVLLNEYRLAFKGLAPGHCRIEKSRIDTTTDAGDSCASRWWRNCSITCVPAN